MIERPTERLRYVVRQTPIRRCYSSGEEVIVGVRPEHVLQQLWQIIPQDWSTPARSEWRDVPIEEENNDD